MSLQINSCHFKGVLIMLFYKVLILFQGCTRTCSHAWWLGNRIIFHIIYIITIPFSLAWPSRASYSPHDPGGVIGSTSSRWRLVYVRWEELDLDPTTPPEPGTNSSISSGFDEGPPSEQWNGLWLVSCPSVLWLANSLDGISVMPCPIP